MYKHNLDKNVVAALVDVIREWAKALYCFSDANHNAANTRVSQIV